MRYNDLIPHLPPNQTQPISICGRVNESENKRIVPLLLINKLLLYIYIVDHLFIFCVISFNFDVILIDLIFEEFFAIRFVKLYFASYL
jgi:hypothetical protein